MKTNEKKNTSAKKKLIPAVAMLTTSAVMLSTATYAWFTLNREVEVDGLQMSATASNSLEISLGDLSGNTISTPAVDSATWTKKIAVSDYYKTIGKLKPASSDSATGLYQIGDESLIYAGGTKVNDDAPVVAVKNSDTAKLEPGKATTKIAQDDKKSGYFIDVPMWIRSSDKTSTPDVYCTVTIVDGENDEKGSNDELKNAVRVAILPISEGNTPSALTGSSTLTGDTALTATIEDGESASIFALNKVTYSTDTVLSAIADKYSEAVKKAPTIVDANNSDDTATTAKNTVVFRMPKATDDAYGYESFIVRVWLEGESTSCSDLTANQDWNINFDFSLDSRDGI